MTETEKKFQRDSFQDKFYLGDFIVQQFATGVSTRVFAEYCLESVWYNKKLHHESEEIVFYMIVECSPYVRNSEIEGSFKWTRDTDAYDTEYAMNISGKPVKYVEKDILAGLQQHNYRLLYKSFWVHRDLEEVRKQSRQDLAEFRESRGLDYGITF